MGNKQSTGTGEHHHHFHHSHHPSRTNVSTVSTAGSSASSDKRRSRFAVKGLGFGLNNDTTTNSSSGGQTSANSHPGSSASESNAYPNLEGQSDDGGRLGHGLRAKWDATSSSNSSSFANPAHTIPASTTTTNATTATAQIASSHSALTTPTITTTADVDSASSTSHHHQSNAAHLLPASLIPAHNSHSQRLMSAPTTVPCQYRTGKTLGSGTYAVVKEAVHIKTGKYYACKVINKKLMEGREYMVRNEITVLKRVSKGHKNIVTLHDYFETTHNLYLCFDLCTGGELFDRICAKGNYYEADAAGLVRTIMKAVDYIHGCGIVHRDLKPENLIFRTKAEDADIMIADFGLSRIMDEDKLQLLTEICGTPGYMAPEIFNKTGHGKPVDIWAMGVITYFLLCGYTPFDRDSQEQEMQAIVNGEYSFEPSEYWENVSETAKDFVRTCLTMSPGERPTAKQALDHRWLASETPHFVADPESPTGGPKDLLPTIQKGFNARKTFRKAVLGMMAMRRMTMLSQNMPSKLSPRAQELASNIGQYMKDAEKEEIDEDKSLIHHHGHDDESSDSSISVPPSPAKVSLDTTVSASATAGADGAATGVGEATSPLSPFVEKFRGAKLQD